MRYMTIITDATNTIIDLSEFQFTHLYWVFLLPAVCAAADIITGWLQATINSCWDSTKMRKGLYRKTGEILTIVVSFAIQEAVVLPVDVTTCISAYVIIMELLSIVENLDQAGIPVPAFVRTKLGKVVKEIDEAEDEK